MSTFNANKKITYRPVDFATALYEHTHMEATVEWRSKGQKDWNSAKSPGTWSGGVDVYQQHYEFRIREEKEAKYREYRSIEEVPLNKGMTLTAVSGEQHRGMLAVSKSSDGSRISIWIGGMVPVNPSVLLQRGKFDDGSPCGVPE
jgi:hypothetical protein